MSEERHFKDEAWVDMVRGIAPAAQAGKMREHLERSCAECVRMLKIWQMVAGATPREPYYEPPKDAVRAAKAAFSAASRPPLQRAAVLCRLVLDSLHDPMPLAVRGSALRMRHLLYETDELLIDLRLESGAGSQVFLAGQALPKNESGEIASAAGIELLDSRQQGIARTATNSLGEFQLEFDHHPGLTIEVRTNRLGTASIPLPDPAPG